MIFIILIAVGICAWRYGAMVRSVGRRATWINLAAALLAGIPAGLLFGIAARVAMRLLAMGMDTPLRWTASGSVAVVVIFGGMGVALALPYPALFRNERRGYPLVFALILTIITLQPFIRAAAQDLAASVWEPRVIIGASIMTLGLWFPYALLLEGAFARIARRLQKCKMAEQCMAI